MTSGRLTLPAETGCEDATIELIHRLGADAVRNSDGTTMPPEVAAVVAKVYETYFVARGDQEWARAHPEELQHYYLMSPRVTATSTTVTIDLLADYFDQQIAPDLDHDPAIWWEVIDRTTGEVIATDRWAVNAETSTVTITDITPWHEYTVSFLAWDLWDPTQMFNHLTNDWGDREHEQPYDARYPATWQHMRASLTTWLAEHSDTDVVRFTTFFYHFTLVFDRLARQKYVDWFGYSASVSPEAIDAFEQEKGYRLRPEDFVDEGYYNSPFRVPTKAFLDWMDFQQRFVSGRARELVELVHEAGKEAMMFLGDNWIGTEPYGPYFPSIGLDAVVGSIGNGATTRMISEIPGVRYTEGRLLPYFFPDVFHPGGDPAGEARTSWSQARRAIARKPLDRIGYGGYVSLALQHPDFIAEVERTCAEFREIHDQSQGQAPYVAPVTVGVLNAWGSLRSWQTHMVAHAMPYRLTDPYVGVLEALSGLPVTVKFLSFEDVAANGVPEDISVLVNAGTAGTAFSGGRWWADDRLLSAVKSWVDAGGGFIGVGEPTAVPGGNGQFFALSDVLGVDKEQGWSLNTSRYPNLVADHFITSRLEAVDAETGTVQPVDVTGFSGSEAGVVTGAGPDGIFPVDARTSVLSGGVDSVACAATSFGSGRSVYFKGLPYSAINARLLHRALFWTAGQEDLTDVWTATTADVDVAAYPGKGFFAMNSAPVSVSTVVTDDAGAQHSIEVPALRSVWFPLG